MQNCDANSPIWHRGIPLLYKLTKTFVPFSCFSCSEFSFLQRVPQIVDAVVDAYTRKAVISVNRLSLKILEEPKDSGNYRSLFNSLQECNLRNVLSRNDRREQVSS